MGKTSASKTVTIKAAKDTVYDLLATVDNYPQWMDEFKSAEVVGVADDGYADKGRFVLSTMGVTMEMFLDYTRTDSTIAWSLIEGKMIEKNEGTYTLEDNGDGSTDVTYELETETSVPLPGMVKKQLTKKVVNDTLKAVKKEAEG